MIMDTLLNDEGKLKKKKKPIFQRYSNLLCSTTVLQPLRYNPGVESKGAARKLN